MVVWRRSLSPSQRYKMFSVVVSWTNNKDPTSDKGIWLFGTEWEARCSERSCPSLAEPFSTLGIDMKAASTSLKYAHVRTYTHTLGRRRARTPTRTDPHMHTVQEVCLSRTRREGRQRKQLSVDKNKKNNSWKGVCLRERMRDKGIRSPSELISLQREEICKGDATIWTLSLSSP